MSWKEKVGYLQIPVSGLGMILLAFSVLSIISIESPSGSEGFVHGLAFFFLYIVAGSGFLLTVGGLALPVKDEMRGIHFSTSQRKLLFASLLSAFGSVISPLMIWRVSLMLNISPGEFAVVWLLLISISISSFLAAVTWKIAEYARENILE